MYSVISNILGSEVSSVSVEVVSSLVVVLTIGLCARAVIKIFDL